MNIYSQKQMNELKSHYAPFSRISNNPEINFRLKWTIKIFNKNAFCSFIPKNACTSIRYSVALKNNVLNRSDRSIAWVHNNNHSFNINLEEAITSEYSFTILRCPISRLASTYLDKFLTKDREAWKFRDAIGRAIDLDDLSFRTLVKLLLERPSLRTLDPHWTPQHKFLLIKDYSNYFCVEEIDNAKKILDEKIDLELVDTRKISQHTTHSLKRERIRNAFNIPAYELYKIKKEEGVVPSLDSMINQEIQEALATIYKDDIEIYKTKFSPDNLFQI